MKPGQCEMQTISIKWFPVGRMTLLVIMTWLLFMSTTVSGWQSDSPGKEGANLPAWVQQGSFHEDDCDYILIETEGCHTPLDANSELNEEITTAISNALDRRFGDRVGQQITFSSEYIKTNLLMEDRSIVRPYQDEFTKEFADRLGKKYGEFYRGYAQLKLDTAFYHDAQIRWRQEQTRLRLITVALVSLTVLALLTTTYGYLRLNQATRGFYSNRLLTIGIAAIMLLAAVTLWLLQTFLL
jgi:hypothetical protein